MASTSRRRRRVLFLGFVALAAALFVNRKQVTGLLGSGQPAPQPQPEPVPAPPPAPSNYDAPGPPANTATAVPVPPAQEPPAIDEAAEEAAAAAEAANIGGQVSDYAAPAGTAEPADEVTRPLAEAGEGEAEGQEQTEAELAAAAEPTAPGASPEQQQIEDAIAAVTDARAGEQVEPLAAEQTPGAPATGSDAV